MLSPRPRKAFAFQNMFFMECTADVFQPLRSASKLLALAKRLSIDVTADVSQLPISPYSEAAALGSASHSATACGSVASSKRNRRMGGDDGGAGEMGGAESSSSAMERIGPMTNRPSAPSRLYVCCRLVW